MTGHDEVLELVLGKLEGVRQQGGYWMARCPARDHDDHNASLSITRGTQQPVIFKCHAGCERDDILDGLGLTLADISSNGDRPADDNWTPSGPGTATATYLYTDAAGKVLMGVCRTADKKFWQWRPDPSKKNGRAWSIKGVKLVPYRLPAVIAAVDAGETVYIAEGEKDVDRLETAGVTATCNPMGAGKWRGRTYNGFFTGANVVIIADRDEPGRLHAMDVAGSLQDVATSVTIVEPAAGKDASDHLAAGYGIEDFADVDPEKPAPSAAQISAPWDGNLAELLDEVAAWIGRYLSVPSPHCITVIVLWAAHTHATDVFYVTPRLILDSAEPESGKTRVLELLNLISRAPIFTMNTTIAALYRRLTGEPRTILLDEADAVFAKGAAQNHEDLRALLNAGYKRGATVDRCVGDGASMNVVEFPVFAPVALAGIAGNMPPTITTRAVTVHMRRRAPDEEIAEFIEEDALDEAAPLREALSGWAADGELKGARPIMPAGVTDRKAEVWRALLAVAEAAGAHWPDTARQACRHFVLAADPAELSLGVRLLADLRDVFADHDVMPSAVIVEKLKAIEDGPWTDLYGKEIEARRLSRMLGKYQVKPKVVRVGDSTPRGYTREQLADLWRRYLDPPGSATAATSATPLASTVADVADVAHTRQACTECDEPLDPVLIKAGYTTHGEEAAP